MPHAGELVQEISYRNVGRNADSDSKLKRNKELKRDVMKALRVPINGIPIKATVSNNVEIDEFQNHFTSNHYYDVDFNKAVYYISRAMEYLYDY